MNRQPPTLSSRGVHITLPIRTMEYSPQLGTICCLAVVSFYGGRDGGLVCIALQVDEFPSTGASIARYDLASLLFLPLGEQETFHLVELWIPQRDKIALGHRGDNFSTKKLAVTSTLSPPETLEIINQPAIDSQQVFSRTIWFEDRNLRNLELLGDVV